MTEYEAYEKRFTEITGCTITHNMREQLSGFSDEEIAAALHMLHNAIAYKKKKLLNPFGYFHGMLFRQREQNQAKGTLKPDDFSQACAAFAQSLDCIHTPHVHEAHEPHTYTDHQVLLLYLLLNASSFSTHYQSAKLTGYTLPELPCYKAALIDFSNNRLPLLCDRSLVDECFKEAAKIDKAEPHDFHEKLRMLLRCFSLGNAYTTFIDEDYENYDKLT